MDADRARGLILGTALGDALGLPFEGLSRRRTQRWMGARLGHRLILGRGMISDDTEQTLFVAQSLLAHPDDPDAFQRRLAWCLRGWLLGLPAGIGLATGRAILKLWIGMSPRLSGVWSAGNGAAMRAAPIGARFHDRPGRIDAFVRAATVLTHTDPRAETGARAVAHLAALAVHASPARTAPVDTALTTMRGLAPDDAEWQGLVSRMETALREDVSVAGFAAAIGAEAGVSGYVYRSVPVAVYAWLRHWGNFEGTIRAVVDCGGDTDTVAAMAGALAGATVGEQGLPSAWVRGLWELPRDVAVLREAGARLAGSGPRRPVRYGWWWIPLRNLGFLLIVLGHGLRRLLPPY
jgi:ADP-ribosyl-[dinitrogen reductase] hydrolase